MTKKIYLIHSNEITEAGEMHVVTHVLYPWEFNKFSIDKYSTFTEISTITQLESMQKDFNIYIPIDSEYTKAYNYLYNYLNPKTEKDIKKLKYDWFNNPCWDIETTEGFEEHEKELLEFRLENEKKWEKEFQLKKAAKEREARNLCFLGLLEKIEELEQKIAELEEKL